MLKDDLKKLGLRVRARPTGKTAGKAERPGKISFDDRGNAVFEWGEERLNEDSDTGERLRNKALSHAGLSIVDDDVPANAPIRPNPKGLRLGYNPYESGMLANKDRKKKVDLEQLSKMIELKRRMKAKTEE
jgi:hypothetical protein